MQNIHIWTMNYFEHEFRMQSELYIFSQIIWYSNFGRIIGERERTRNDCIVSSYIQQPLVFINKKRSWTKIWLPTVNPKAYILTRHTHTCVSIRLSGRKQMFYNYSLLSQNENSAWILYIYKLKSHFEIKPQFKRIYVTPLNSWLHTFH